jgi:hypothetical protein
VTQWHDVHTHCHENLSINICDIDVRIPNQIFSLTDRQTDGRTDRQTGRQAGRQRGRHSNLADAVPENDEVLDFDFTCQHTIWLKKKVV